MAMDQYWFNLLLNEFDCTMVRFEASYCQARTWWIIILNVIIKVPIWHHCAPWWMMVYCVLCGVVVALLPFYCHSFCGSGPCQQFPTCLQQVLCRGHIANVSMCCQYVADICSVAPQQHEKGNCKQQLQIKIIIFHQYLLWVWHHDHLSYSLGLGICWDITMHNGLWWLWSDHTLQLDQWEGQAFRYVSPKGHSSTEPLLRIGTVPWHLLEVLMQVLLVPCFSGVWSHPLLLLMIELDITIFEQRKLYQSNY